MSRLTRRLHEERATDETDAVDPPPADPLPAAARLWAGLDGPWREAFRQAWEALRSGNIAVGACASTLNGEIVGSARNRVTDSAGLPGEIFGSALAHAETNVLARLPFRCHQDLVLTTTLQPCLQCAGAIRLGPIGTVRFAGPDRYWDGCHDFGKLSARAALRGPACQDRTAPRWARHLCHLDSPVRPDPHAGLREGAAIPG